MRAYRRDICSDALRESRFQISRTLRAAKQYKRSPAARCCPIAGERRSADRTAWSQGQRAHASAPKKDHVGHAQEAVSSSDIAAYVANSLGGSAIGLFLC